MTPVNASTRVNQTSLETEYYTDKKLTAAAHAVMGGISLDVASSAAANKFVGADIIFVAPGFEVIDYWDGIEVRRYDGWGALDFDWYGNIWMNHPFGSASSACKPGCTKEACIKKRKWHTRSPLPGNKDWVQKLVREFESGRVDQAICITFAATSEAWFLPLLMQVGLQCFLVPRTNYYLPDGSKKTGVTKGSVITGFGVNVDKFRHYYNPFGVVK